MKIVAILGPTATGKSSLGVELAKKFRGEIIACDSRQVYRGLEAGTGKATPEERSSIGHFLIDVVNPDEHFSAADYRDLARAAAGQIAERGNTVFLVGGTGFYFRAFLGWLFPGGKADPQVRSEIEARREKFGDARLYQWLGEVDPESAGEIHPHDIYRISRALEIFLITGQAASKLRKQHGFPDSRYQVLKIGLQRERDEFISRIAERAEWMYETGVNGQTILDEVEGFFQEGYDSSIRAFQTIGYREAIAHYENRINLSEAKEMTKRSTWDYARRQMTWFRKEEGIVWFHPGKERAEILTQLEKFGVD